VNSFQLSSDGFLSLFPRNKASKKNLVCKANTRIDQIDEANTRIDQIENDVTKNAKEIDDTYERLLSMERYSRDYNLRFYNIPESTGEDCIAKLRDIIGNDLQLQANIENAHRIGPFKDDGTPRPILAKFLYRLEWFRVIKKRDLRNGVHVSDDLIWEDRQKKKQLRSVMKEAFETGKRPRFHHGKLHINGELHQA